MCTRMCRRQVVGYWGSVAAVNILQSLPLTCHDAIVVTWSQDFSTACVHQINLCSGKSCSGGLGHTVCTQLLVCILTHHLELLHASCAHSIGSPVPSTQVWAKLASKIGAALDCVLCIFGSFLGRARGVLGSSLGVTGCALGGVLGFLDRILRLLNWVLVCMGAQSLTTRQTYQQDLLQCRSLEVQY